jgi:hypothetical protein
MSNPGINKIHLLGRMLRDEESRATKLLNSDRLQVTEAAKNFSRALIDYSHDTGQHIDAETINIVYRNNFSQLANQDDYQEVAEIFESEFNDENEQ